MEPKEDKFQSQDEQLLHKSKNDADGWRAAEAVVRIWVGDWQVSTSLWGQDASKAWLLVVAMTPRVAHLRQRSLDVCGGALPLVMFRLILSQIASVEA